MEKFEFKGTPGIWLPSLSRDGRVIIDENRQNIAVTFGFTEEDRANAYLLAAAPLLLSALIKAVEEADQIKERTGKWDCPYPDWYHEAKAAIQAAISQSENVKP